MDWNGDGKPDLLAIDDLVRSQSEVGSRWTLLLGDGRGHFADLSPHFPRFRPLAQVPCSPITTSVR